VTTQNRKLKLITFTLGGNSFECQVKQWNIANNSDDGEKLYAFCPDGEFREEAEPDYALELTFFSDWRSNGVSDYITVNDQQTVAFVLDHHPDIPAEHVRWSGTCKLKAPSVGGEARTTEMTETTAPIIGKPTYLHL
jgi:hypothetical protein